ncbi:alpha-1,4-N-acetylglucosaminyltransferase-like, partial [Sitodiplosis mosellana]|uniref:alpha-1,4-N-acetylglucosaminyltransferase-like n=1 Tax=Sitodiplosis mosellana TaxID=263140 RepID=UPI002443DEE2
MGKEVKLLDDIMTSPPKLDRTIFFQDTSCKNGIVSFTPRQACAIESTAMWNPNRDIFVLFTSPVGLPSNGQINSPLVKALSTYSNIQYRNVDWYKFSVGTPAEEWVKKDKMLTTIHFMGHLSDFLRLLALYKFGGIHIDLDFIVKSTFEQFPPNFIGAQDDKEIQNSFYGFESRDVGHKIVELFL